MTARKLPNYLKARRKLSGFSQEEVAFLLSSQTGASISRYEHFSRKPNLETALALEALFRTPVRELFAGMSEKEEANLVRRAKILAEKLARLPQDRLTVQKLQILRALCNGAH